jgi:hypothetical protein
VRDLPCSGQLVRKTAERRKGAGSGPLSPSEWLHWLAWRGRRGDMQLQYGCTPYVVLVSCFMNHVAVRVRLGEWVGE